jgi:hypothetical protein
MCDVRGGEREGKALEGAVPQYLGICGRGGSTERSTPL